MQVRLDLSTGKLAGPYLCSGREHDQSYHLERLPRGALLIRDLGYFALKKFKELNEQEVYWLSRVKSNCDVIDESGRRWGLLELLKKHCHDEVDMQIMLGVLGVKERVPCRLLAVRVPDEVARVRRCKLISEASRKGKKPSKKSLELASWTALACNVPYEKLSLKEAFVLMRTRWQIELIFKLWKSCGFIDEWRTKNPWRILCDV